MILSKVRDPRMAPIRRGGTLTDDDHQLLARWAAECAEHVLGLFEREQPDDPDAGRVERDWQRSRLPGSIRSLVLEDQVRRNDLCWSVFSD
ncbi:putative immunity protein [Nocardioides sp.]|uniref:putative immunity protein n=1 Tax=Nocardioides sp. TaxID=35761 RepID=UPI002736B657|nr:hypothetical protein [Nocardioides sp.]MDP3889629.1 hypothetical protein [Nocardioides sp.]